jgi:hypothetical protein
MADVKLDMESSAGRAPDEVVFMALVASLGLLGFFVINTLFGLIPIKLVDPIWQLTAIGSALGTSFYPLISAAVLSLLLLLRPDLVILSQWLQRMRRYAFIPVVGYLLFIPVQGSALLRQQVLDRVPATRTLAALSAAEVEIRNSRTVEQLSKALANYPNNPKLPANFNAPLEPFKDQLIDQIGTTKRTITIRLDAEGRQRNFNDSLIFLKVVLLCMIYSLAFAAVAQPSPSSHSLLQGVIRSADNARKRHGQLREQRRTRQQDLQEQRDHSVAMRRINKLARQQSQQRHSLRIPPLFGAIRSATMPLQRIPLIGRLLGRSRSGVESTLQSSDPYLARLVGSEEKDPTTPDPDHQRRE